MPNSTEATKHVETTFLSVFLIAFSCLSFAECETELNEIQPRVRATLEPLHNQINLFIPQEDFQAAYRSLDSLYRDLQSCADYLRDFEFENYSYDRWGESSRKYDAYANKLYPLVMQIQAGYESHDLGLWRILVFKSGMWEKVAKEFYEWSPQN